MFFDERNLPCTIPFFDCFFSSNSIHRLVELLMVDKPMQLVSLGKPLVDFLLMLGSASFQAIGEACIKNALWFVRQDVDAIDVEGEHSVPPLCFADSR